MPRRPRHVIRPGAAVPPRPPRPAHQARQRPRRGGGARHERVRERRPGLTRTPARRLPRAPAPRRERTPAARSNSTSQWPAAATIAFTAAADSGARPRLVCTSTPVALITGVSAAARAGSSATAASATSSGAICPALACCWARPTAALTSGRPSLRSASARRGSASSRSVRGTRRLSGGAGGSSPPRGSVSTSRTIPRGIGIQRPLEGRDGAVKTRTTKKVTHPGSDSHGWDAANAAQ